jgi:mRNA interferase MazF
MKSFDRWSIWLANLDPVIGSEQGKTRPVIVISDNQINQLLSVVNVLPITSRKQKRKIYPNEALIEQTKYGLPKESIVLCYQIRTLDKARLLSKYGEIKDDKKQSEILEALCFQLGIEK